MTKAGDPGQFLHETTVAHGGDDCLRWPYAIQSRGYGVIWIDKLQYVHRLVCERTHGPAPLNHDAAHICGRRDCCSPRHIVWKTRKENMADTLIHDTHRRGTRNNLAKVTEADVRKIRALEGIKPQRVIAEDFGIARETVSKIHRRASWAWLE